MTFCSKGHKFTKPTMSHTYPSFSDARQLLTPGTTHETVLPTVCSTHSYTSILETKTAAIPSEKGLVARGLGRVLVHNLTRRCRFLGLIILISHAASWLKMWTDAQASVEILPSKLYPFDIQPTLVSLTV